MKFFYNIVLFISFLFSQEPDPIKSGIAPYQNEYTDEYDVLSYDLEIGLGEESNEIVGKAIITLIPKKDIDQIMLDFTGLSIQNILINSYNANYSYKKGKISISSKEFKANQALSFLASGQIPQDTNSYSALNTKKLEMTAFRNQSIIGLLVLVIIGLLVF